MSFSFKDVRVSSVVHDFWGQISGPYPRKPPPNVSLKSTLIRSMKPTLTPDNASMQNELTRTRKLHPRRATAAWMKIWLPYEKRRSYIRLELATARKRPGRSFQFLFFILLFRVHYEPSIIHSVFITNLLHCASITHTYSMYTVLLSFPARPHSS